VGGQPLATFFETYFHFVEPFIKTHDNARSIILIIDKITKSKSLYFFARPKKH